MTDQSQHADIAALPQEMERNLSPDSDEDEMSAAAVWILALIAGMLFVAAGFGSVVWMVLKHGG